MVIEQERRISVLEAVLNSPLSPFGIPDIDYVKALELSDADFDRFYSELMGRYWRPGNCASCGKLIDSPESMVRYLKNNLHRGECFVSVWNVDAKETLPNRLFKEYFDRVASLKLPAKFRRH
jgi:hypothetical protein